VGSLHVKRNKVVGDSYLEIEDTIIGPGTDYSCNVFVIYWPK
jgi:hypothetical protein